MAGTIAKRATHFVLQAQDGGEWDLGQSRLARKNVGQLVEIRGKRIGFDGLTCNELRVEDEERWQSVSLAWEALVVGLVVAITFISVIVRALG